MFQSITMEHNNKTASKELEDLKDNLKENLKKEMEEHIEKMNEIVREAEKQRDFLAIFNLKVKKWGGSAHVQIPRRYEGHEVRVIILNKKKEEDQT